MHAITPAVLGSKQLLVGQCDEFFFRGIPIRQTVNAADADSDHSMRGIAVRDAEHAHLFAKFLRVMAQIFDIGRE